MTDKEIVLAKWPDAEEVKQAYYGFAIVRKKSGARLTSRFWLASEDAWADAARRITEAQ